MNTNYEEWDMEEWQKCLELRERVLNVFNGLVQEYVMLPANNGIIERELLKSFKADAIQMAFESILPPATNIIHNWDKNSEDVEFEYQIQGEDSEDEESQVNLSAQDSLEATDKLVAFGKSIREAWIHCMAWILPEKSKAGPNSIEVLYSLSTLEFYLYACHDALCSQMKIKAMAIILHAQKKIPPLQKLMLGGFDSIDHDPLFRELKTQVISRLGLFYQSMNKYYSMVSRIKMQS